MDGLLSVLNPSRRWVRVLWPMPAARWLQAHSTRSSGPALAGRDGKGLPPAPRKNDRRSPFAPVFSVQWFRFQQDNACVVWSENWKL